MVVEDRGGEGSEVVEVEPCTRVFRWAACRSNSDHLASNYDRSLFTLSHSYSTDLSATRSSSPTTPYQRPIAFAHDITPSQYRHQ
jgi:hypothetical protein